MSQRNRCAFVLVLITAGCVAASAIGAQSSPRPKVMIVGSVHLASPSADFNNLQMGDILSETRQREVRALAGRLAAFRPTKVALEFVPRRDSLVNVAYALYRAGGRPLEKSEREQLGFRIAGELGHPRVFGIDATLDLDVGGLFQFAAANGMQAFVMESQRVMQQVMAETQREAETLSLTALIAAFNRPEREALMNAFYLRATQVSRDTSYVGARLAGDWYTRNFRMLANLHRVVTAPDERVLVIVGAAHAAILRSLVRDAGLWELVDPLPLLTR